VDYSTKMRRLDIIVHRCGDPPHARLHPHKHAITHEGRRTKEAQAQFGYLSAWLGETSSQQALNLGRVPQQDVIGRRSALECLSALAPGFTDLTDGKAFPWHRYLHSSPSLRALIDRDIVRWAAVTDDRWHIDGVFLLADRGGQLIIVHPRPGEQEISHEVPAKLVSLAKEQGWIS
jgi:hypothetical protein